MVSRSTAIHKGARAGVSEEAIVTTNAASSSKMVTVSIDSFHRILSLLNGPHQRLKRPGLIDQPRQRRHYESSNLFEATTSDSSDTRTSMRSRKSPMRL
jgi:hypothetical protein